MRGTQRSPFATKAAGNPAPATPPIGDGPHGDGPELVGYARVSTRSQKDDTQIADLTAAGCARIFTDHGVSGKHASRPELDKAVAYLQEHDTFVITRLSRAMRSLKHLLALADDFKNRGIGLKVLKQEIDTTTSTGRLVFHILAAIDEWLRELIVEGTKEGLEVARANGHRGGRKPALTTEQEEAAAAMFTGGKKVSVIAGVLEVDRATIYRALRKHGLIDAPDNGHGGRPAVTPEQAAEVLRLLRSGHSVTATHEATGLSRTTVRQVWRDSGEQSTPPGAGRRRPEKTAVGGRPRGLSGEQAQMAAQLTGSGESLSAVAAMVGRSPATVKRAIERLQQEGTGQ